MTKVLLCANCGSRDIVPLPLFQPPVEPMQGRHGAALGTGQEAGGEAEGEGGPASEQLQTPSEAPETVNPAEDLPIIDKPLITEPLQYRCNTCGYIGQPRAEELEKRAESAADGTGGAA